MKTEKIIDIFIDLVKIDSPTNFENEVTDYVLEQLQKTTTSVKKDTFGNIYAYYPGEGEPVFLSAHLDTVEPGRGINPIIGEEYITSDGSTILGADNKVALAVILAAMQELPSHHRPLELVLTVSEEIGNYGAINYDYSLIKSKKGYCFDISQPIGTIISASPYYERFDITLHGVAAHASQPEEAIPVLQALQEILSISPLGRIDADTLFNIGVVEGGQVRNTVLGQLTLKGEIRSFVENKLTSVKEIFRNNISKIAQTHHLKIEEDWVRENPGYKHTSEESQKFITETQKIMKALTIPSQIIDAGGVSDANIFNDKGLLCINLGDGSEFTHTLKERIAIKDLTLLLQIIDKVIQV